jgi:hypothetical protein
MIVKHIPINNPARSSFAGLISYIGRSGEHAVRRPDLTITNCQADLERAALREIQATQERNTRATGDKTLHLLVSFRAGETPDRDSLVALEERICAGLGYGEHQRISAVHTDTDNLHIHIAINKIHPTTHQMVRHFRAYRKLAELCSRLEVEFGLEPDNHLSAKTIGEDKAADMEKHSGQESLISYAKRTCLDGLRSAPTWSAVHQAAEAHGLAVRMRGNGLVIEADDGTMVKASSLDRSLSKARLEARLGSFEASATAKAHVKGQGYDKAPIPLRVDTSALYERYQADMDHRQRARDSALKVLDARKASRLAAAQGQAGRVGKLARSLSRGSGRLSTKLLSMAIQANRRGVTAAVREEIRTERKAVYDKFRRVTWLDWLKNEAEQGNQAALEALRARRSPVHESAAPAIVPIDRLLTSHRPTQRPDHLTKKGTLIFRAGANAIRDDGRGLQLSDQADHAAIAVALRIASERYGSRLTLNGKLAFKVAAARAAAASGLDVTFTDPTIEAYRYRIHEEIMRKEGPAGRDITPGTAARPNGAPTGHATPKRDGPGPRGVEQPGFGIMAALGDDNSILASAVAASIVADRPVKVPEFPTTLDTLPRLRMTAAAEQSATTLSDHSNDRLVADLPKPGNELRRAGDDRSADHSGANDRRDGADRAGSPPAARNAGSKDETDAAGRYIAERTDKRAKGIADIVDHARYAGETGPFIYRGARHVDGEALILLHARMPLGTTIEILDVQHAIANAIDENELDAEWDIE